ncbi:MAG: DUF465 domain-containing protein [Pseudomonadota bacterium]
MAMKAHLESLAQRHEELKTTITEEMKHPSQDENRIVELKRQKLKIKDQLENLKQQSKLN